LTNLKKASVNTMLLKNLVEKNKRQLIMSFRLYL